MPLKNLKKIAEPELIKPILYRSAKLTTLNIIGVVLLFFTNHYLIKLLGEQGYGNYVIINVWLQVFSIVVLFGMDDYFVAILPKYYYNEAFNRSTPQVLYWAAKMCLVVFIVLACGLLIAFNIGVFPPILTAHKLLFFLLLCELGFLMLVIAFFRSINKVLQGQMVDKLLRPALLFFVIVGLIAWQAEVTFRNILWLQVLTLFVCIVSMLVFFRRMFTNAESEPLAFDKSLKLNVTFLGISLLYTLSVRLDIMFLTDAARPEEVGYYNIAARISDLVGYPLTAINLIAPTLLSKEFHKERSRVLPLLRNIVLIAGAGSLVGLGLVLIAGKYFLLFFGENFMAAFGPLVLLSSTHLLAAFALPMNTVLMVSNHQKASFFCLCINVAVTFCLCILFIKRFGSMGAAMAVLAGNLSYLVSLFLAVRTNRYNIFSAKYDA